jgi:hypothetical protein
MNRAVDRIRALSLEAYTLALGYAREGGTVPVGIIELRDDITALHPLTVGLEGHDAQSARVAISEALLDLDWIESGGQLATSVRLGLALASMSEPE